MRFYPNIQESRHDIFDFGQYILYNQIIQNKKLGQLKLIFCLFSFCTSKFWCGMWWLFDYFAIFNHFFLKYFLPVLRFYKHCWTVHRPLFCYIWKIFAKCCLFDCYIKHFGFYLKISKNLRDDYNLTSIYWKESFSHFFFFFCT